MKQCLDPANVYFILVRPVFLGNIGSVARLSKNFGFRNLRLVDAPRNYKDAEARKMAVGAFDILKASQTFSTLSEAISDINIVIGTSAGQQRSLPLVALSQAIEKVVAAGIENKIAVVLGDERNGLSNDELSHCHVLMRIETDPAFASLNVAQAACVIAYELSRFCQPYSQDLTTPEPSQLPSGNDDKELFEQVAVLLDKIEFSRKFNKDIVSKELRRFYHKAEPTKRESDLLRGILHKLNQALK